MTELLQLPLFWASATLAAFLIGQQVYMRSGSNPLFPPILIGVALLSGLLLLTGTPYQVYMQGGALINMMLGPVIVMLAVPLYQYLHTMRRHWQRVIIAIACGSGTTIVVAAALTYWWIGDLPLSRTIATKSITTPVAVAISDQVGGLAAMASAFVIATGILGALMAPPLLRLIRRDQPHTVGLTLGICAHAIGTSRALELGQQQAAYAALAMTLTATLHALVLPSLLPWLI
jgi:putative effector of murein hydrolase